MQKITKDFILELITKNNIPFMPTQTKLCVPIIDRIYKKMMHNIQFEEIKVCDNLIIDGHHRYLSAVIANLDIGKILSHKTSATKPIEWNAVLFDENDWDTPSKILHLNETDAVYNNMDIEFVKQIIL